MTSSKLGIEDDLTSQSRFAKDDTKWSNRQGSAGVREGVGRSSTVVRGGAPGAGEKTGGAQKVVDDPTLNSQSRSFEDSEKQSFASSILKTTSTAISKMGSTTMPITLNSQPKLSHQNLQNQPKHKQV